MREHLTWLLASVPSNPPPLRPPRDNSLTSQSFSTHNNIESLPETDIVRSGQCPNNVASSGGEGEDYSENPPPSASQVPVFHSDETMVRLQSGPRSSKKSRLLSQPDLEPLQTPKASQPLGFIVSGTLIRLPAILKLLLISQTFMALQRQSRKRNQTLQLRLRLSPRLAT